MKSFSDNQRQEVDTKPIMDALIETLVLSLLHRFLPVSLRETVRSFTIPIKVFKNRKIDFCRYFTLEKRYLETNN